jgi:hypothetical protein
LEPPVLHPHVHEDVKHFAKTLFTTFLGLLMALALESWHQERHRRQVAREALESVLLESQGNRKALQDLAAGNKDVPRNLGVMIGLLESLQDARSAHRPWRPRDISANLTISHTAGNLKSSAWNMALADQSVQRFPKGQAGHLAALYQQMGRLQAFLDQPVDYSTVGALGESSTSRAMEARLQRFSDRELERVVWDLRKLKVRFELIHMWAEALEKSLEDDPGSRPEKA